MGDGRIQGDVGGGENYKLGKLSDGGILVKRGSLRAGQSCSERVLVGGGILVSGGSW